MTKGSIKESNDSIYAQSLGNNQNSRAINMMRKVRSLDRLRVSISKPKYHPNKSSTVDEEGEWTHPTNKMASTFSSHANRRRFSRSTLLAENDHLSSTTDTSDLSRSSYANLHSLDARSDPVESFSSSSAPSQAEGIIATFFMFIFTGNGSPNGGIRIRTVLNVLMFTLLFFATLADVAVRSKSHINDLSAPLYYDALSTERAGLGSAMIGSVTQALSPILPFAGGMDLRRDENWGQWLPSWVLPFTLRNRDSESSSVLSDIPRGGAGSAHDSSTNSKSKRRNKKHRAEPLFSATNPFVSVKEITQMTLADVAITFKYAIESSKEGFDRKLFQSKGDNGHAPSKLMLSVIDVIDDASQESRGNNILPTLTHMSDKSEDRSVKTGEVDALKFCAAMRILAEWRVIRQVPAGYKGYAVGMNLGHKDVVQNLAKIETVVHDWIASHSTENEDTLRSPTIRQLLQYEVNHNVHPNNKLPILKEKSVGMGLLWVRRQLHYQTAIFANILNVPDRYPETKTAVGAAYTEVYGKYHGWAVQKIFNYSFQAAPQAVVIYRHMNPKHLAKVMEGAKGKHDINKNDDVLLATTTPTTQTDSTDKEFNDDIADIVIEKKYAFLHALKDDQKVNLMNHVNYNDDNEINQTTFDNKKSEGDGNIFLKMGSHIESEWSKLFSHMQGELHKVGNEWDHLGKHIGGEWDKFGDHVVNEWNKLSFNVVKIFDQDSKKSTSQDNQDIRGGASSVVMTKEELDHYIDTQMEQDAHRNIKKYLDVARPLLEDLEGLFSEMNMDDPTKV